ncbi:MAG TPA: AroM family protein [Firmicutes bacterium]|nr:AroM family protein [Bacillota bacterium]
MGAKVGAITIGQSPRTDVIPEMIPIVGPDVEIIQGGALDGLTTAEVAAMAPREDDYVLVTKLRDGTSVQVAKRHIVERMQEQIRRVVEEGAQVVALLCTGEFPELTSPRLLVEPQLVLHHATAALAGGRRLGVVVPAPEQVEQGIARWEGLGRGLRVEAASPYGELDRVKAAAGSLREWGAELVVLDCIGFTVSMKKEVREVVQAPVILPRTLLARTLAELLS